jgi:hypothetical protein
MKIQNPFFVICVSMMFVPVTHSMLINTKCMPNIVFKVQKRNSSLSEIRFGKHSIFFDRNELIKWPEMYDYIKKLGAKKCVNFSAEQVLEADYCHSPICCGRAILLGYQKNVYAARTAQAIRNKFLRTVAKKGKVAYLQDIKERYIDVVKYRIMLNEFYNNTDRQKRLQLYSMTFNINACLFNQAQVILEDSFEDWKKNHFKITPEIETLRSIRTDINEWYENEKQYKDGIVDEQAKEDYKNALVYNRTITYKLNRIDEEYKLLHSENQTRE